MLKYGGEPRGSPRPVGPRISAVCRWSPGYNMRRSSLFLFSPARLRGPGVSWRAREAGGRPKWQRVTILRKLIQVKGEMPLDTCRRGLYTCLAVPDRGRQGTLTVE